MKYQRKIKPEEQNAYPISANYPAVYEQGLSHSFHEIFFRYSVTDTYHITSEFDSSSTVIRYIVSEHSG